MKRRMMLMLAISLMLGTLVFGVGATSPWAVITVDFECLPALAAGVPVGAIIGGPNCNCPASAVTGFTDAAGKFTAKFDLGLCDPNNSCWAYATAESPPKPCKGKGKLAPGSGYQHLRITGEPTENPRAQRQP